MTYRFGELGVVGAQGCALGGRHHRDPGAAPTEPRADWNPRVAGRLHHDTQGVVFDQSDVFSELFEFGRPGEELSSRPYEGPL